MWASEDKVFNILLRIQFIEKTARTWSRLNPDPLSGKRRRLRRDPDGGQKPFEIQHPSLLLSLFIINVQALQHNRVHRINLKLRHPHRIVPEQIPRNNKGCSLTKSLFVDAQWVSYKRFEDDKIVWIGKCHYYWQFGP
jgi:hypothetical protein